jgi:succinate dehydrogenase/fumarate reductase cytochrome b subunit
MCETPLLEAPGHQDMKSPSLGLPRQGCGCGKHGEPTPAVEITIPAPKTGPGCACQSLATWRRLHAFLGAAFGLFALAHLTVAAQGLAAQRYQALASALQTVKALLVPLSWLLFGLPVLLAGTGLYLLAKAGLAYGIKRCNRGGKARFAFQRWTSVVLLAFLAFHLCQCLRVYSAAQAFATTRSMVGPSAFLAGFYALGIVALAYHTTNGLNTAWVFWKLPGAEGPSSIRPVSALIIGALIAALGACACWAFAR